MLDDQTLRPRCFLCGARMLDGTERRLRYGPALERAFAFACGSCGALWDGGNGEAAERHWTERARGGRAEPSPDDPYGFDAYTLRSAATLHGLWAEPLGAAQADALREPHSPLAGRATLQPFTGGPTEPMSVAILCRERELDEALALAGTIRVWCDDCVILIDGDGPGEARPGPRLHRRPLAGDFSAQRNAAQALARHEWVLQLDLDETLDEAAIAALPGLLARLGEETVSIGLRRINLVDGVRADLFPDTQYRLNRRSLRFEGRVHERPVRPWQRSLLFLGGGLLHHLARAHVEARSQRYESMAPGGGRLFEEVDLLRPYQA
ncbi:hypothetical protein M673_16955 [Aureimonas sp. AU20]|nr:hypothetical protein M673_16955 [Aureimonas sp. AU20]